MATIRQICSDALIEIGVVAAGETLKAEDAEFVKGKLHRLLDNWNAERAAVYADQLTTHTLTPNLQPHTIGPSTATFTVTQRPVEIVAANLIVDDVRYPLEVSNRFGDWQAIISKETESDYPTDLVYRANWPNGSIYLWPEPSAAVTLELLTRVVLSKPALADDFDMPPGYQDAVTLTLAEESADSYGKEIGPKLANGARRARARIFGNNDQTPTGSTVDVGMGQGSGAWDWRTGGFK
jgi:hypothetical protein